MEGSYLSLSMERNIFKQNFALNGGAIYKTSLGKWVLRNLKF